MKIKKESITKASLKLLEKIGKISLQKANEGSLLKTRLSQSV